MNWTGLKRTKAPVNLPVKLDVVKEFIKIDDNLEDSLLKTMIGSATKSLEDYLNRSLITQTWVLTLDNFNKRFDSRRESFNTEGVVEATKNSVYNEANFINLKMGVVKSITSLITYNDGNVPSTFSASRYYLDTSNDKSRLVLNDQDIWPTDLRLNSAVEVTYVSGFGDDHNSIPDDIKMAIVMIVANMYEHRCSPKIDSSIASMVSNYKIYSMG